jgi:hypothetical protein
MEICIKYKNKMIQFEGIKEAYLMAPARSVDDPVIELWHYPTFCTALIEFAIIADMTNISLDSWLKYTGGSDGRCRLNLIPYHMQRDGRYDHPWERLPEGFNELCE